MTPDMLRVNPAWRLQDVAGQLYLSGGLDATYLLDELAGEPRDRFAAAWDSGSLTGWRDVAQHPGLLDKLHQLGVLYRPLATAGGRLGVGLRWAGAPCAPFEAALHAAADADWHLTSAGADLVLLVRTTASLLQTADVAADLSCPHVLVDLAHHETVVLGPLVVRGETACLGCLAGRMNQLWGDPPPAAEPAMLARAVLVASLVAEHLRGFVQRRSMPALVQQAWSLSLATWETELHPVFLLPWCPLCQPHSGDGRIAF